MNYIPGSGAAVIIAGRLGWWLYRKHKNKVARDHYMPQTPSPRAPLPPRPVIAEDSMVSEERDL